MDRAVSDLRHLSSVVQAHESVLDVLVNKSKECPCLPLLLPCKWSWEECLSFNILTKNKFRLTFVCPVSLCVVECGPDGLGWEVTLPKEWVRKWGPALLVTLKVLQVAAVAGRVLGLPIPSLPSSKSLGLDKDSFTKQFLAKSWDSIAAHCTVDAALSNTEAGLKAGLEATIPSLEAASINTVKALKNTDEAYKIIHAFLLTFGAIEDIFRGKMSREQYRGQVEWISVKMVEQWREILDQRAVAQPALLLSPTTTGIMYAGTSLSSSADSAADPSPFPWLVEQLEKNTQMERSDIRKCVRLLVKDGIDDKAILAAISPDDFTKEYLKGIGISSVGAQQQLLRIHKEIAAQQPHRTPAGKDSKLDNKIVDPADARKVAALEKEMLEKTRAANEMAKEAAKQAAETKSMMDAFVDATGVGAGGQMQHAVRTKDGKIEVVVTSPATEQRLDTVASTVEVNRDEQEQKIHELEERLARMEREKTTTKKKSCTVS